MTRKTREEKVQHTDHEFVKVKRSIPNLKYHYYQCKKCGFVEYPFPQMQKLWEYSETHRFMFLQDWVLALLYAQKMPMIGITSFMKQLFLTLMEFAQENNIPTENPGFRGYKFGPYSERIEDVVISLEDAGLIRTEGRRGTKGEYFMLTEEGEDHAKKSFNKLTEEEQKALMTARLDWHQLGTKGLMKYIYTKYPRYTDESLVVDRVLHRRRVGNKFWEKPNAISQS